MLKMMLIFVGVIVAAFIIAGIAMFGEHAFLLWVGIGLLIAYAISGLVVARRNK